MKNPIESSELFTTPQSVDELQKWILLHTGSERALAMVAAGMAWNLAAKLVDDTQKAADDFNTQSEALREDFSSWDYWTPVEV
jgi:hypothetical protein